MDFSSSNTNNTENFNFETRVKKYKQYRRKIKSDYSNFVRRNYKNDEIKKIEKQISRIDKSLLINDFDSKLFVDFSTNWTNNDGYVVSIKNYLDTAKTNNFNELLSKVDSVRNDIDIEPSFDTKGNLSLIWYKQDPNYYELEKIWEWIKLMVHERDLIISNVKDKLFSFKDAFYQTNDPESITSILSFGPPISKIAKNKRNKKIFFVFLWGFFVSVIFAILFIILFLVIN